VEVVDEDKVGICFCLDGDSAFDRNREKRRMAAVSAVFAFEECSGTSEVLVVMIDDRLMIWFLVLGVAV
jgi:hypothetical protein